MGIRNLSIQLVMGVDALLAITAMGGKYGLKDNRETPDTLLVTYDYPSFICTYENRECNGQQLAHNGYGISFHGTDATLYINRNYFEITPEKVERGKKPEVIKVENKNNQGQVHMRNFLYCIKSRHCQLPTSRSAIVRPALVCRATWLCDPGAESFGTRRPRRSKAIRRRPNICRANIAAVEANCVNLI